MDTREIYKENRLIRLMKLDNSKINFSHNDVRRGVKIPEKLTSDLSYLIGFHVGDGSLSYHKKWGNYNIDYSGHMIDEYELHKHIISAIYDKLFNAKLKTKSQIKKTSITSYYLSKAILTFFNKTLGMPIGSKSNQNIPKCILEGNKIARSEFLCGKADADFCLTFKRRHRNRHYYPTINYSTPNARLIKQIFKLILNFGIKANLCLNIKTERKGKELMKNMIDIYGTKNLEFWMKNIGFKSGKHLTKYKIWKKYGYCPPKTNIIQRKQILNGEIPIENFYK